MGNIIVSLLGDHMLVSSPHEFICYMLDKKKVKDSKKTTTNTTNNKNHQKKTQ